MASLVPVSSQDVEESQEEASSNASLWDCVGNQDQGPSSWAPAADTCPHCLLLPSWAGWPPHPPAAWDQEAALDPLQASLRTPWPMGKGEGAAAESAVEQVGTNPASDGAWGGARSAARRCAVSPEQPPQLTSLTAPGKV